MDETWEGWELVNKLGELIDHVHTVETPGDRLILVGLMRGTLSDLITAARKEED